MDAIVAWADAAVADTGDSQTDGSTGTQSGGSTSGSTTDTPSASPSGTTTGSASTGATADSTATPPDADSVAATGSSGRAGGGSSTTVGQAEVAVTEAELAYTTAQLALEQATLVAPVDGVLTAMPFVVGETAAASDVATITTGDGVVIPIEVAVTDIAEVAAGQSVAVTDATGGESEGEVSTIALLPTTGATTYTVTVAVDAPAAGLAVGTAANLVVTIASSDDSVLAPISAITLTATGTGTVRVLADNEVTTRDVSLGIIGTTHVEVTDGLSDGESVVLSDASEAIPTSDSSSSTRMAGGGFTGGGFPGGGMQPPG